MGLSLKAASIKAPFKNGGDPKLGHGLCLRTGSASFVVRNWRALTSSCCAKYRPEIEGYSNCALQLRATSGRFEVCIARTLCALSKSFGTLCRTQSLNWATLNPWKRLQGRMLNFSLSLSVPSSSSLLPRHSTLRRHRSSRGYFRICSRGN